MAAHIACTAAMFGDGSLTDVELHVNGQIFKAHRYMLAAHSAYFKTMFTTDTKERQTGIVEVKNYSPEIVEKILRFIYSAHVNDLESCARELLWAADFYNLVVLQELCTASIVSTMTVQSALNDMTLAYAHKHLGDFKDRVLEFAKKNAKAIAALPKLNPTYAQENPEIVVELFKLSHS